MNAWSHLPNAHHIDWVLASLKENPELWDAARDAAWSAAWSAARAAARAAAWDAAWVAVKDAARAAAWDAARNAVWDAAWSAAWVAARDVTRTSIAALIAWDDCDQFLNMPYEKLQVWAVLSEDPRAILLLPMVRVKERLALLATV